MHYENDNSMKWDPILRSKTKTAEEAAKIIQMTGRIPRPLPLSSVKIGKLPVRKTIVATAKERRKAAEMESLYAVTKLQAKLLLKRERHPIWGHERVLVFGNMISEYLLPDVISNDPIEVSMPIKFKAAFSEDADPHFPTREVAWNKELERRGLKPEIAQGKVYEKALRKQGDNYLDIPTNLFTECMLDNVIDLGELVLQFYSMHVDRQPTSKHVKQGRMSRRLNKKLQKEFPGLNFKVDMEAKLPAIEDKPTQQELGEFSGGIRQLTNKGEYRTKSGKRMILKGFGIDD